MTILLWILLSTILIALLAFAGAFTLFLKEKILDRILIVLVALSAGALLGGAFIHLLPEAVSDLGSNSVSVIFLITLMGFCTFLIIEQFLGWHHCHKTKHDKKYKCSGQSHVF